MAETNPTYGTVINKTEVRDKRSGKIAANTNLGIGLVYLDGANGWKQAPTDGSIKGKKLYWNEKVIDNSTGALGDKTGTFYGEGALVVGKSDGAINVDEWCKASETANKGGQFQANAEPADAATPTAAEVNAIYNWQRKKIAIYKGHTSEITKVDGVPTASADGETNCVFQLRRG